MRWRGGYGAIAKHAIYVDTPGLGSVDLRRFPYQPHSSSDLPTRPGDDVFARQGDDPHWAYPSSGIADVRGVGPDGRDSTLPRKSIGGSGPYRSKRLSPMRRRSSRVFTAAARRFSRTEVLAVAESLVGRQRWVAYELLYHYPERSRWPVDRDGRTARTGYRWLGCGRCLCPLHFRSGMAPGAPFPIRLSRARAASPDRLWRRAALVSTVPLNLRAAGGTGDTERTLDIRTRLVADRDDMVVKALLGPARADVLGSRGGPPIFGGPRGRRCGPGPARGAIQARDRPQAPATVSASGTGEVTRTAAALVRCINGANGMAIIVIRRIAAMRGPGCCSRERQGRVGRGSSDV